MGRWQPGAHGRLQQAAMELFVERGYEVTTVAQIAERAGVTERTFFRYFSDKREVLFAGSDLLVEAMSEALREAPTDASPAAQVTVALHAVAELLPSREHARSRQSLIDAHPELRERELIKMARLSVVLAELLQQRKVPALAASVAAESGVAVFRVAFAHWVGSRRGSLREAIDHVLTEQAAVWGSSPDDC